jgi:tetratricopeptide (TPR) repeat protein
MIEQQKLLSNPFPGLRPFETEEYYLFFGREGQSNELLKRLQANRFVAVIGTSGSGKSSLVRAGLLPILFGGLMTSAGSSWRVAIIRPGNNPTGNLARALSSHSVFGIAKEKDAELLASDTEMTLRRSSLGLVEAVRHAKMQPQENLLIVVDQFEELFRIKQTKGKNNSEAEAAAFVKLLIEAIQQTELPIYVVLTMRSDYLGECAQFRDLPEAINRSQYLIPRMNDDERREAIASPIAVEGGAITLLLVNRLVNDAGDSPDQLPILQHALMRTWDYWRHNHTASEPIDISHYEQIGGIANALSQDADKAYDELSDSRKRIAEKVFKCLTEKGPDNREIRRPTTIRELSELADEDEEEVIAVIRNFRDSGRSFLTLLETGSSSSGTLPEISADTLVDISHESLIRVWDRLRGWADEEALSARTYRRLAERAIEYGEGKSERMRNPALQFTLDWRERHNPTKAWAARYHPEFQKAMAFLDESKAAHEAEAAERERYQKEQFELSQKQQLAEERAVQAQALAAEQTRAASRLRKLVVALIVMFVLAGGAAVSAVRQGSEASKARQVAEEQKNLAENQARLADEARTDANLQAGRAEQESREAGRQAQLASERYQEAEKARKALIESQRKAEAEHLRAEEQAKAVGAVRLQTLNKLGGLYREAISLSLNYNKQKEAAKKFEEILEVYNEANVHSGQISALMSLAELYTGKADLEDKKKAVPYYRKALELFGPEDNSEKVTSLINLGGIFDRSKDAGEKMEAAGYYEQALAVGVDDVKRRISVYRNLGDIYSKSKEAGDIRRSIDRYEKEFTLLQEDDTPPEGQDENNSTSKVLALIDIGINYSKLGSEREAKTYFDKARKIRRPNPDVNTLMSIGKRFMDLGDKQRANRFYDEAVEFSKNAGDKKERADTLRQIGAAYSGAGDKEVAITYYNLAIVAYREIRDKGMEANTLKSLATVYRVMKRYQEALDKLNEAIAIYKEIGDKSRESITNQDIEIVKKLIKAN